MSFKLTDHDTSIVLLALRHLQRSMEEGQSLKAYTDIHPEPELVSSREIDELCEALNCETIDENEDAVLLNESKSYEVFYSIFTQDGSFIEDLEFETLAKSPEDALTKLLAQAVISEETVYQASLESYPLPSLTMLDNDNYRLNPIALHSKTHLHFGQSNLSIEWLDDHMLFQIYNGSHELESITLNFEELFTDPF